MPMMMMMMMVVVAKEQSTNHRLVLINMNLAHNVCLIDMLFEEGVLKYTVPLD